MYAKILAVTFAMYFFFAAVVIPEVFLLMALSKKA